MKDNEVQRVHINNCVRDSELEKFERSVAEADPGDWRVVNGEVERYGGKPWERPEPSKRLMALSIIAIPRLLRGIRALEEALRNAWAAAESARAEWVRTRDENHAAQIRASEGKTGPDEGLVLLAEAAELGIAPARLLIPSLKRWTSGVDIANEWRFEVECARKRRAEQTDIQKHIKEEDEAMRAEMRRLLAELRAGRIPSSLRKVS